MKATVAIIGAGMSGLVSAKEILKVGMIPIIFEKENDIGGIWHPKLGFTWDSMCTNISRYNCSFSDFAWSNDTPIFPKRDDVYLYLKSYCEKFHLLKHIRFSSNVLSIKKIDSTWSIIVKDTKGISTISVNFVIVSSGFFSQAFIPTISGINSFNGEIIHSKDYKKAEKFKNKVVTVIGSGFSGIEISADLSENNIITNHIFRRPSWVLKKYINNIPLDLYFNKREEQKIDEGKKTQQEKLKERNIFLENIFGNPGKAHPDLYIDVEEPDLFPVTISDKYTDNVKCGAIKTHKGVIEEISNDSIKITNGNLIKTDVIIFCTGYRLELPYFEDDVLSLLVYDKNEPLLPIVLYKNTFTPYLKNIAFVGIYKGSYFAITELQARWVANQFKRGNNPKITNDRDFLNQELAIRNRNPKPQFSHNYVDLADSIAQEIGIDVNNKFFLGLPVISSCYRIMGNIENTQAFSELNEIKDLFLAQ